MHRPRDRLGSAAQLTLGMFHGMGQMATASHYCIPQTPAIERELDKIRARRPPPTGRTDRSSPTLHNSSRNMVYFSEKSVTSPPPEKPR